ncbi:glycosyltransferase [Arenibacter sp. 6A1]|uniref:glycosyltransferase n=1 Tax=Arenibacter sp. 6A1 TaxID=2720391 RepID=UPI001447F011|nr:glycosyltransferase [Arenibacter sp. 6A1]NKI25226.1 glycosyltransferase [Arenibacter sp. 6A1]
MKKVLCVIDSLGSGGAQKQLVELAKGFKEKGYSVSFLTYYNDNFYKKELDKHNISIRTIIEPNYVNRLFKMRAAIRQEKPDSVLSFLSAASFIATVSGFPSRKWKLVVGERSANPNILKSFKLRFYRWLHLFADYVAANSQANIDIVKKVNPLLPDKKCKVIYNAVKIQNKYNLTTINDKYRLVIGASHRRLKNLDGLIEAVNLLPLVNKKNLIIDWYGEKNLDDSYSLGVDKIKSYKLSQLFNFHEPTTDLMNEIKHSSAIGLFSIYEGFPNFICEGMALGKPIICSPVSDLPVLLKDNINAFFFDPNDPQSIAESIVKLMDMDEGDIIKMCDNNQAIVEEYFDRDRIVNDYLTLLS